MKDDVVVVLGRLDEIVKWDWNFGGYVVNEMSILAYIVVEKDVIRRAQEKKKGREIEPKRKRKKKREKNSESVVKRMKKKKKESALKFCAIYDCVLGMAIFVEY